MAAIMSVVPKEFQAAPFHTHWPPTPVVTEKASA